MKRKGFILVLLLIFSLALFGCEERDRDPDQGGNGNGGNGNGGSENGGGGGEDTSKPIVEWYKLAEDADYDGSSVTIDFWHRMGEENQNILKKWIVEFKEVYPNITVNEVKIADDYDALANQVALAIPAGNAPHITESYPDHVARYGKSALALNNFITNPNIGYSEEEIEDFLSGLWLEGQSYDNAKTVMSMPFTKSSEALFYNKAYFDKHDYKLPERGFWTWEEIFEIAEDIKKREPTSYPFGYDSSDNMFITMSEQWNAPYTGYDSKGKGTILFNNDTSKEMIKYFKDKIDRGLMTTRSLNGAFTSDIMKTGEKLYMFVGSTGGARYSIQGADEAFAKGYRVGVAPVPVKDINNRKQIQQGPNISLFSKKNEQEMIAAWLFSKFILEPERTAEFALQSGYAPIRHSAYETKTWTDYVAGVKENPETTKEAAAKVIKEAIEMFRDNENIFFTSAVFNLSSKTRSEVGSLLDKIFAYKEKNLDAYINDEYEDSYDFIVN